MNTVFVIPAELDGLRLDAALKRLCPRLGLRACRRAVASGLALRDGHIAKAGCRVRAGDVVSIDLDQRPKDASDLPASLTPRFLERTGDYILVDKPSGLHCAALAGQPGPDLEALLPRILPDGCGEARLLQRLDCDTSGLVCAALNDDAVKTFRAVEREGACVKHYLALLCGRLTDETVVRLGLDTAKRRKSRLTAPVDDRTRWTEFTPLAHLGDGADFPDTRDNPARDAKQGLTLAGCRIRRGARHQIRAHAAALGHPLQGDALYGGGPPFNTGPAFFLHHSLLVFPGGRRLLLPPWNLPPKALQAALQWLKAF
ncbi:MAG: pseudouridine synthase [Desulfovibrio sp.]|jgi:23S rRNA pseudouridine1911/1915/1917 synthase|nr:pseudouridine synthase [Desulfovibrio sp.]